MSDTEQKKESHFWRLVTISSLTKLADLLVSPKTTLPWILSAGGAPSWMISLLVPIKESGSLLPQWLLNTTLAHRFNNHSAFWRVGALTQGLGIGVMVLAMLLLDGNLLAYTVLTLLMGIAFGRAICSLSMKSIQAQSVAKGRRGRLIGMASSISGGLTMASALVFLITDSQLSQSASYVLLLVGGALFLLSMLLSLPMSIESKQAENDNREPSLIKTVLKHADLRNLIVSRVLLMHSALIVPFIVAQSSVSQQSSATLSYYVALSAVASMVSSYVWGTIADSSALKCLRVAAVACIAASFAVGVGWNDAIPYGDLMLFFILTLGHAGIRTGRKTYLLDITDDQNRSGYVAAANTCVGIALLTLGGLYAWLSNVSDQVVLLMSSLLVLGLIHSFWLKNEK